MTFKPAGVAMIKHRCDAPFDFILSISHTN